MQKDGDWRAAVQMHIARVRAGPMHIDIPGQEAARDAARRGAAAVDAAASQTSTEQLPSSESATPAHCVSEPDTVGSQATQQPGQPSTGSSLSYTARLPEGTDSVLAQAQVAAAGAIVTVESALPADGIASNAPGASSRRGDSVTHGTSSNTSSAPAPTTASAHCSSPAAPDAPGHTDDVAAAQGGSAVASAPAALEAANNEQRAAAGHAAPAAQGTSCAASAVRESTAVTPVPAVLPAANAKRHMSPARLARGTEREAVTAPAVLIEPRAYANRQHDVALPAKQAASGSSHAGAAAGSHAMDTAQDDVHPVQVRAPPAAQQSRGKASMAGCTSDALAAAEAQAQPPSAASTQHSAVSQRSACTAASSQPESAAPGAAGPGDNTSAAPSNAVTVKPKARPGPGAVSAADAYKTSAASSDAMQPPTPGALPRHGTGKPSAERASNSDNSLRTPGLSAAHAQRRGGGAGYQGLSLVTPGTVSSGAISWNDEEIDARMDEWMATENLTPLQARNGAAPGLLESVTLLAVLAIYHLLS